MERDMGLIAGTSNLEPCFAVQGLANSIPKEEPNASFSNMLLLTAADEDQLHMTPDHARWASLEQSCVKQLQDEQALTGEEGQQEPPNESDLEPPMPIDQASAALYLADDYTTDNENFDANLSANNQYMDNVLGSLAGSLSADHPEDHTSVHAPVNLSADDEHQGGNLINNLDNNVHHSEMVINFSADVDHEGDMNIGLSAYDLPGSMATNVIGNSESNYNINVPSQDMDGRCSDKACADVGMPSSSNRTNMDKASDLDSPDNHVSLYSADCRVLVGTGLSGDDDASVACLSAADDDTKLNSLDATGASFGKFYADGGENSIMADLSVVNEMDSVPFNPRAAQENMCDENSGALWPSCNSTYLTENSSIQEDSDQLIVSISNQN